MSGKKVKIRIIESDPEENSTKDDLEVLCKGIVFQDENNKTSKGKSLAESIKQFNNTETKLFNVEKKYKGKVTSTIFNKALEIYENNQSYYSDNKSRFSEEKFKDNLKELEKWFCDIEEPKPKDQDEQDDWLLREKQRKKGVSSYCLKNLTKYLK